MKLLSKPTKLSDVFWWLALSACLLLLYFTFVRLGIAPEDSKGLSLLGLFAIVVIGLLINRWWFKSRWDRRFEGLTLEQHSTEIDKVFEEQVAAGVITRAELESICERARIEFERKHPGGHGGNESV